jgi:4-amino-4-deoxy-L-arabinose transferase-like glycosyltransferase
MEQHAGSLLYYPVALMVGFFPWVLTLVFGLITVVGRLRRGDAKSRACVFALCWIAVWFTVFTLSASKLSHYIAPTYPLLAVIAGLWIADWISAPQLVFGRNWFKWGWPALAALGIGFLVALPLVVARFAPGAPSSNWLGLILIAGAVAGWIFQRRGQPAFAATSLVVMAVALFTGIFAIAAVPISKLQTSVQFVEAVNRYGDRSTPIATYRIRLPDFVYYAGRNEPIMGVRLANASAPGASIEVARAVAPSGPIDPYQPDDTRLWLDDLEGTLLITDLDGLAELRPILPPDTVVLEHIRRFLKPGELLLVGRRPATQSNETASRASDERK